ncbi:hypothetical protein VNI00_003652 [Paramarasmius palmivorus]|uniref:Uncharacterized protein n=1 Tax=Paramarasmius palmivorus TaxID=297713 RepID=A0AAW0DPL6_9AGAR
MKLFVAAAIFFPFLLGSALAQEECPLGYDPVEFPPGSGNIQCRKIETRCPIGQRPYKNPVTNADSCCPDGSQLVIYDEKANTGACCGEDQYYAGIKPNGKCCAKGETVQDGKCVPVPPPSSCQGCPSQPAGACALKSACGDSDNTGLKFGSCYQLLFPNGQQLGRGVGAAVDQYTQDGYLQNIPFKVCKAPATGDCGTGPVKSVTDAFVIQDMLGPAGTSGGTGWMDNKNGGGHMQLTTNPADARTFHGKTSCSACKCTVQLTSMGYACPAIQPGITFWANPKVTLKLQFLEIPCNGKYSFPQLN